ncbi:MAG: hypothetical protein AAFU67_10520, partial [Bacteroidota bacterium]
MKKTVFILNITLKDRQSNQAFAAHSIQAWFHHADKADTLLGVAETNETGECEITFEWDAAIKQSRKRPVYCKVFQGDKELYNSLEDGKSWWLVMNEVKILLQIAEQEAVDIPFSEVPVSPRQLHTNLTDWEQMPTEQKGYVEEKLRSVLLDRLLENLAINREKAGEVIGDLDLDLVSIQEQSLKALFEETLLPALREDCRTQEGLEEALNGRELPSETTVKEILQLDKAIKDHPAFQQDASKLKMYTLVSIAAEGTSLAPSLAQNPWKWENATTEDWEKLIEEKDATKEQVVAIQQMLNLGRLTNDHFGLVQAIYKDDRVTNLKDLVQWEVEDWQKTIERVSDPLPVEETPEAYIGNVMAAVERSYPTAFFMTRVTKQEKAATEQQVKAIKSLLKKNGAILDEASPDWSHVNEEEREAAKGGLAALKTLAHTYRYLGIKEIIQGKGTAKRKSKQVSDAIAAVDTLYKQNPQLDLLRTNFIKRPGSEESTLDWSGIDEEMRPKVQRQMLSFQRVRSIAPNHAVSAQLLAKGMDSAYRVTNLNEKRFVATSGLEESIARQVYATSERRAAITTQHFHAIRELHQNQLLGLTVDNT